MSLENEIKEAFVRLASEVRVGAPAIDGAVGRARRRGRGRRLAFGSLGLSFLVAAAVVVPRLIDTPSRGGLTLRPGPAKFLSDPTAPPSAPGLHLELSIPSQVVTAEIVEATVRVWDDSGTVTHDAVLWGETPGTQFAQLIVDCAGPPNGPAPMENDRRVLRHAYRTPGTYTIRVQIMSGHCQDTEVETKEVSGTISVVQGGTPSNGPLAPTPHIEDRRSLYEAPPLEAAFYLGGGDEDGFVRRVVVDWGDGTVETLVDAPLSGCEETPGLWPSTYLDGRDVKHVFAPGTYTLTVTVTSVGCGGEDSQTQSEHVTLTMPA